jgi:ribosomal protein S18 acetylase RimI-like enzyme
MRIVGTSGAAVDVTYRFADLERDAASLADLWEALGEAAKAMDPLGRIRNDSGFGAASLREALDNVERNRGAVWFACAREQPVGFAIAVIWEQSETNRLEIGPHTVGEVTDLFVAADFRRRGVATRLLRLAEGYLSEAGCDSFWLNVFAPNIGARRLYEGFGFIAREIGMLKQL